MSEQATNEAAPDLVEVLALIDDYAGDVYASAPDEKTSRRLAREAISALAADRDAAVRRLDGLTVAAEMRRERIATAALQGLLAGDASGQSHSHQSRWSNEPADAAGRAVELADALIAALDAKAGKP